MQKRLDFEKRLLKHWGFDLQKGSGSLMVIAMPMLRQTVIVMQRH